MGVESLNVENRVAALPSIGARPAVVLPELLPETFVQICDRLTDDEIALVLRERLVPLTSPTGYTFYADAAPWRKRWHQFPQIVTQVPFQLFANVVWKQFAPALAKDAAQHLKQRAPHFSAHQRMTNVQKLTLLLIVGWLLAFFVTLPFQFSARIFCEAFSIIFASLTWLRFLALGTAKRQMRNPPEMNDEALPTYSVLVPLYKEARMLPQLIQALRELDYPPDKLDIKIILEEKDVATRMTARRIAMPSHMEVLVVPAGKPQTKPRALNYALHFARGDLLTIYDAEDAPAPMQLRCAARAFAEAAPRVACMQAKLAFHNADENWLSRQFALEYAVQFGLLLPALARHRLPLPLGGTSNHFRTSILRKIHGWDAHNVTEDADLGLRLARAGYRCGVINSETLEEANVKLGNWLSQRARWLKGFMQTWLVHMRDPRALRRHVGWLGFLTTQTILFGVVLSALLHPLFLGIMGWQIVEGSLIHAEFGPPWFGFDNIYIALLAGNYAVMMYCGVVAGRKLKLRNKAFVIASMPVYWILTSVAGWMALWQLIRNPHHLNKTRHGLSRMGTRNAHSKTKASVSPA